ncbi:hypothetical protein Sphch_3811 [Sphingobium chlorophenolicum L-1]|uniref:Uncharacterized protein n=1 Tax=Sphingobium chlorophenolicum L-1 TaxID=690566 RepID=F6F1H7_SPHCR|nr:hypothetical protein Sphch_3811 [Sphingobium chlorophenolicum L-1]
MYLYIWIDDAFARCRHADPDFSTIRYLVSIFADVLRNLLAIGEKSGRISRQMLSIRRPSRGLYRLAPARGRLPPEERAAALPRLRQGRHGLPDRRGRKRHGRRSRPGPLRRGGPRAPSRFASRPRRVRHPRRRGGLRCGIGLSPPSPRLLHGPLRHRPGQSRRAGTADFACSTVLRWSWTAATATDPVSDSASSRSSVRVARASSALREAGCSRRSTAAGP